jgi:oxygen-independent coproporphyrinogen-3 oxidase
VSITALVRRALSAPGDDYALRPCRDWQPRFDPAAEYGLYIHVPFCRNRCPYCPYNTVPWDPALVPGFVAALRAEIRSYRARAGRQRFSSLYIGGGTPTLMAAELAGVVEELRRGFDLDGPVAIETGPNDVTRDRIRELRALGADYISLGVQSFNDRHLAAIGRNHSGAEAARAAGRLAAAGFRVVNLDLIFALPGQTREELGADLAAALALEPGQITCYPLFTFPYSAVGRFKRLRRLRMPPVERRRRMYYQLSDTLRAAGRRRTSVWSFNRPDCAAYSSVTRDYYLGFGPGAASYDGHSFCFNTFSFPEYLRAAQTGQPTAVRMAVSGRMRELFWFYWRLYETEVPARAGLSRPVRNLARLFRRLGLAREERGRLALSDRGAHWIHLAQNHFALNYVNRVWSTCLARPWPDTIRL